jgi:hypothetical protein
MNPDLLVKALKNPDTDRDEVAAIDPNDFSKYFPADQARHLLATAPKMPKWYPFVLTAIQTGMRKGELKALRYDRINWRGGYITVKEGVCRRLISTPKNGKTRTVSMSTGVPAENTQFEVPVRATLGSGSREGMGVRVSPFAPITCRTRVVSRHLANSRRLNAP